jgi:hypothetical protein
MMIADPKYQENALMFYQGPVTVNLISYLGNYIQSFLPLDGRMFQRIFRIFVELTQNVSFYSDDIKEGKNGSSCGGGWFSIQDLEDQYRLTTGNLIKTPDGPKLEAYCSEINSLEEEALRKLKRDIRSNAMMRDISAQVGLIQIGILSNHPLEYQITKIDRLQSFFIVSTRISKS